jgi:hypothetical protein
VVVSSLPPQVTSGGTTIGLVAASSTSKNASDAISMRAPDLMGSTQANSLGAPEYRI